MKLIPSALLTACSLGASVALAEPDLGGPMPKPLTAEQVGLVRAWIDQGAK